MYIVYKSRECIVKVAYFNMILVLFEEFLLESFPTNIQNISFDGRKKLVLKYCIYTSYQEKFLLQSLRKTEDLGE